MYFLPYGTDGNIHIGATFQTITGEPIPKHAPAPINVPGSGPIATLRTLKAYFPPPMTI
ncbi:MAG: hypothetical protein JRH15_18380 [Deltaproteobacteria bacterium]|nr:hypothetical protein [Deltaproteobacteria bacterium]